VLAAIAASDTVMRQFVSMADPARRSHAWDDRKITAHHAIIPTAARVPVQEMSETDRRVYDLIRRRYVAQFYAAHEFDRTRIELLIEDELLHASGRVTVVTGWRAVIGERSDDEGDDDQAQLPRLKQGDPVRCAKAEVERKQTQPPARYTEGTLIQAMKSVGRLVQDAKLRQVLKETSGIGTEATRASIIETLLARGYVIRQGKKKHLVSTPKGRTLIAAVPDAVKDATTTALWEQALDDIAHDKAALEPFLAHQRDGLLALIGLLKAQASSAERVAASSGKAATAPVKAAKVCPKCKIGKLVQKTARKGARSGQQFWACNRWPVCGLTGQIG
jgi:DNA topoisomerase-3